MSGGQIFLIAFLILGALFFFGWGLSRYLFPGEWRVYQILVAPLVGYAIVATFDYILLFFGINLTYATFALVALASLINVLAWRQRPPSLSSTSVISILSSSRFRILILALALFLITVAPLFRYGYITLIGENWDFEFYLPLAEYLKSYPIAQLASAPANPLIEVLTSRHIGPLPMGFSYLHTTVNVLFGFDALDSFVILCGILRALGVVSAYVFYRTILKMSDRASLVASALYAASGLLLWVTFWGFGLHLASLAILPLALTFGVRALRPNNELGSGAKERGENWSSWRGSISNLLVASLMLAALNVTFHPTLIAALMLLGFIGLHALIARPNRIRTIQIGISLLALALLFSFPTLFHIEDFRREYYGRTPLATGLRDFIPGSDGFGTSLYTLSLVVGQTIPTPWLFAFARQVWDLTAFPVELIMCALVIVALVCLWRDRERRAVWYLAFAAMLIYVLVFRLDFLHPYPYGFLKAVTIFVPFLLALIAEGLEQVSEIGSKLDFRFSLLALRASRFAFYILALTLFSSTLFTLAISLEQYFKPAPMFFNSDALSIREARTKLPGGATIFLTDRTDTPRVQMGLSAFALRDFALFGNTRTGYAEYKNVKPGALYDFALLTRGEEPLLRGYESTPLWSNSLWKLNRKPEELVYHLDLNQSLNRDTPLTLGLSSNLIVTRTQGELGKPLARRVSVALAAFEPLTLTVDTVTGMFVRVLGPGLNLVETETLPMPGGIRIVTTGEAVAVFAELYEASENRQATLLGTLLARASTQALGESFTTNLQIVNPTGANLQWQFIVRGTRAGKFQDEVFVQDSMMAAPTQFARLDYDPARGALKMSFDGRGVKDFSSGPLGDGKYRASLEVFRDDILLSRLDLYQWERKNGRHGITLSDPTLSLIAP